MHKLSHNGGGGGGEPPDDDDGGDDDHNSDDDDDSNANHRTQRNCELSDFLLDGCKQMVHETESSNPPNSTSALLHHWNWLGMATAVP